MRCCLSFVSVAPDEREMFLASNIHLCVLSLSLSLSLAKTQHCEWDRATPVSLVTRGRLNQGLNVEAVQNENHKSVK